MSLPIFLLSDFGRNDTYVGQMKSVLVDVTAGSSQIVDLTHRVGRGDVEEGAFHISRCLPHLPRSSVLLAVVDPGVGTDRRAVCCRSGQRLLVGPDNGLFGWIDLDAAAELPYPSDGCSRTFHGRDLFAPSAGRLAVRPGWFEDLRDIPMTDLVRLQRPEAKPTREGMEASVAHVDRFGNVVLWLPPGLIADVPVRRVRFPDGRESPIGMVDTYNGSSDGLLLLQGSQGLMEIALCGGSAAAITSLKRGDRIVLVR
jgi:hypothetical protein